ncbi:MAG TPA: hypothetical protein DET40_13065 [Lentisphaeria bacterium]|nr:MAG: hypothetical protein A2X45_19230 [Lentisphaerae bacterium GWF2_50_93]HCE44472.1 hypothetical protein [Lentisphaeria bacterium]
MKRIVAAVVVFFITLNAMSQADSLVVFNGSDKKSGKSWASPKETVSLAVSATESFNSRSVLELKAKWSNWWAGGGWNWRGWYGSGDDISQFANMTFSIKKASGDFKDISVQLVDTTNKASKQLNIIESGSVASIGSDYAKVTVPLAKLGGDYNSKSVWGINFGIAPKSQGGECIIYIAEIEFGK